LYAIVPSAGRGSSIEMTTDLPAIDGEPETAVCPAGSNHE
jgi:hypothetical protein